MHEKTVLSVRGRGKLEAYARPDEAGVTVYLDNGRDLEFWADVRLTEAQLRDLLRQVTECQMGMEEEPTAA
jgi:hypothetical protein